MTCTDPRCSYCKRIRREEWFQRILLFLAIALIGVCAYYVH